MVLRGKAVTEPLGMRFTPSIVIEDALIEKPFLSLTWADGIREGFCGECMKRITKDDKIVTVFLSTLEPIDSTSYNAGNKISLGDPIVLHVTNSDGNTCLEDFVDRYKRSLEPPKTENPQ
jgi:hypothetical protein